jgi:hypothetical protein
MQRVLIGSAIVFGLTGAGYVAGRAQAATPAFEITVDAPGGETSVRCVRGCTLTWVERGVNPNSKQIPEFQFSCNSGTGGAAVRPGASAAG